MQKLHQVTYGILLNTAGMACFAIMNVSVRWVAQGEGNTPGMSTTQMVFLRNIISLALILAWTYSRYGPAHFHTRRLSGHAWRAGIGFLAMEIWFYALSILPLTLATALSFTTPIFGTLFAMHMLKERAGWRHWMAIAISFAGVMVILRPGPETFDLSACIVLLSSGLMAVAGIVVKSLTTTEPPETIVFYMLLFMTPLSLLPALPHWQPITADQWIGLSAVALFSTGAHLLIARSYRHADMVTLLPLDFLRLLFTAVLAWLIFGEIMDAYTLAGALIILASAIYIVRRQAVQRKIRDEMLGNEP